jgi:succinyl-CoA synthetase beta subunit
LPRFGEVLKKLKKYWQWAATGVVVLLAFILGRRGKSSAVRSAKDIAALKNKEIEIINKSNEKEEARKMAAVERLLIEQGKLREEFLKAQTDLDREIVQRKIDLLNSTESSDEIDKILLSEFGIKEIK